jgi:hypothetical protein
MLLYCAADTASASVAAEWQPISDSQKESVGTSCHLARVKYADCKQSEIGYPYYLSNNYIQHTNTSYSARPMNHAEKTEEVQVIFEQKDLYSR